MDKDLIEILDRINENILSFEKKQNKLKPKIKNNMILKVTQNVKNATVTVDTIPAAKGSLTTYRNADLRIFHDLKMAEIHSDGHFAEIVPLIGTRVIFEK